MFYSYFDRRQVAIKKLDKNAKTPTYGSEYSAGADLYACTDKDIEIKSGETAFIPTGLAMQIPTGLVGLIYARSGLACKRGLAPANKVGVIDSDYRGEIMVALHNHTNAPQTVRRAGGAYRYRARHGRFRLYGHEIKRFFPALERARGFVIK